MFKFVFFHSNWFDRNKEGFEVFGGPEEHCTVRHDRDFGEDLKAVHEGADTVSNFSLKSSGVFHVANLTFHLDVVANK